MASNNDLLSVLGTTPEYATPQQIADARALADNYLPKQSPQIGSRWQAADYMVRALLGQNTLQKTYGLQRDATSSILGGIPTIGGATGGFSAGPSPTSTAANVGGGGGAPPISTANLDDFTKKLIQIESGGNPNARTGSYRGLGQFGRAEEKRYGINDSNWTDPKVQLSAIQKSIEFNKNQFKQRMGREPTPGELYLVHQQGIAGGPALLKNPDLPAWKAIRPFYKSDRMAKLAVSGNIPSNNPLKQKSIDEISAAEFANMWTSRFDGDSAPITTAALPNAPVQIAASNTGTMTDASPVAPVAAPVEAAQPQSPGAVAALPPGGGAPVASPTGPEPMPQLPPISPNAPIQPELNAPQQTAQFAAPTVGAPPNSFETSLPPPPPPGLGLPPEWWRAAQNNPELATQVIQQRQQLYTPQEFEVEGGKIWRIPATNQTGFIAKPTFDKMKVGDMEIPTVQRVNPQTGMVDNTNMLLPGAGGGAAPSGGVPVTPEQEGNLFTPGGPSFGDARSVDDLKEWTRRQDAATKARELAGNKATEGVIQPISDAIEMGSSSTRNLQILGTLEQLEEQPATQNIWTGPGAETWLKVNQFLQNIPGMENILATNQEVTSAEALQKIGIMLATQSTKELTSRPAVFEFQKNLEANPSVFLSPTGRRSVINFLKQLSQQNKAIGRAASDTLLGGQDKILKWPETKEKILNEHPIKWDYKGMPDKAKALQYKEGMKAKNKEGKTIIFKGGSWVNE